MSVPTTSTVPPDVVNDVTGFSRALMAAVRASQMYSPEHPSATAALERLKRAAGPLLAHPGLSIGATPHGLMVNGEALPANPRATEAAILLHDHDVLRLRVNSASSVAVFRDLVGLLTTEANAMRDAGGAAQMWERRGHRSIDIDEIDFRALMSNRSTASGTAAASASTSGQAVTEPAARDGIWETIVRSMSSGVPATGLSVQQRLLEIARSADAIESLTLEAAFGERGHLDMPRLGAQAATVLTTFQRLVRTVETQAPSEVATTVHHLAEAASRLDPQLLMRAIAEAAESGIGVDVTTAMGRWFDDDQVAHLLAQSLAAEGKASGRIAAALQTLTPDPSRRTRVLRLARTQARGVSGGDTTAFDAACQSLEQLLGGPGDSAFASAEYSASIDDTESRSYHLSLTTPGQMDGWIRTVSSDSIRSQFTGVMLDLLVLEDDPVRLADTSRDTAALAEDLLVSADTIEVGALVDALSRITRSRSPRHASASEQALDTIGRSAAMREMSSSLNDFDDSHTEWFAQFCQQVGPAALDALVPALVTAADDEGRCRLERVIERFGDRAVAPLVRLIAAPHASVGHSVIDILGRIATNSAIAELQKVVAGSHPQHAQRAVIALVRIGEPRSLRPLTDALRDGAPAMRERVVDALVASQAPQAGDVLVDALTDLDPLGEDHGLVLRILAGLHSHGDAKSVSVIAGLLRTFSWRHVRRSMRIKRAAGEALASMPIADAGAALDEAIAHGDMLTRNRARSARRRARR
jgi:hypothetical protein